MGVGSPSSSLTSMSASAKLMLGSSSGGGSSLIDEKGTKRSSSLRSSSWNGKRRFWSPGMLLALVFTIRLSWLDWTISINNSSKIHTNTPTLTFALDLRRLQASYPKKKKNKDPKAKKEVSAASIPTSIQKTMATTSDSSKQRFDKSTPATPKQPSATKRNVRKQKKRMAEGIGRTGLNVGMDMNMYRR